MKKLLLLVVALVVAFGCKVKGADVVESFESFTDAKKTWLPSTQSANAADYESTITGLAWTVCNVNAAKNTGKIYMTFKKDVSSYMETIPGIVCDKIVVNVGFAGANGGITVFVGETQISHTNVPAPGDYTFDIPVEFQKVDAKFKIVNTKKEGASTGNQISVMSITFKEASEPQPIELGDITVTYGVDATPVVDGDTLEGVVEGTVFTFSAENAESIVVTNSENTTIAQGVATADWTATVTDGEELTVTATLGEEEKTFTFMLEVVEAPQPDLGEIIVKYGDEVIENQYDTSVTPVELPLGATLSVSAENATVIQLMAGSGDSYVYKENIGNPATLTLNTLGNYPVTLFASRSDHDPQTKTFYFEANVVEAPQPVLGNIIVTYGDGIQVAENDEVSVEVGTTFTFAAENATNITVERIMESLLVVNEEANTATWTPEFAFAQDGIIVTATDGTNESTFEFYLTVTEPVLPATEEYSLVSSMENLVIGTKYILVGSTDKAAKVGIMGAGASSDKYRTAEDVTDASSSTIHSSYFVDGNMDVCPFVIEEYDGGYALKLGNGNYLAVKSYDEDKSIDLQEAALGTKAGDYDVTKFAISIADGGVATIKNGNLLSFNAANTPWRFKSYAKQQSPVYLYKLVVPQPEAPAFDLMEDDATKVSLMSTKGELHVWTVEYDKDGNAVKENGEDVAASVMAKAPAADDTAWTNKVAEEGENYEIYVPVTAGNYLSIRAKSVLGDLHSEELVKNVDASGNIISSVEGVAADYMNSPVEYFNLQGVRVAADQPGLYIRRQGSKVEKVAIAR